MAPRISYTIAHTLPFPPLPLTPLLAHPPVAAVAPPPYVASPVMRYRFSRVVGPTSMFICAEPHNSSEQTETGCRLASEATCGGAAQTNHSGEVHGALARPPVEVEAGGAVARRRTRPDHGFTYRTGLSNHQPSVSVNRSVSRGYR
jgi:hypothetical protein